MTYKICVTFELLDSASNKLQNKQDYDNINIYIQIIYKTMIFNGNLEPFIEEKDNSSILIVSNFADTDFKLTFLFKNPIDELKKDDFFRLFLDNVNLYEPLFLDTIKDGNIELEQFFISNYIVISYQFQTIELTYKASLPKNLSRKETESILFDNLYNEITSSDIGAISVECHNNIESHRIILIHYNIKTKFTDKLIDRAENAIKYINKLNQNDIILANIKIERTELENNYWVELLIFIDTVQITKEEVEQLLVIYKFFIEYYNEQLFSEGINSITPENFFNNESLEIIDIATFKKFIDITEELHVNLFSIRLYIEFRANNIPDFEDIIELYKEWLNDDEYIESEQLSVFPRTFELNYE